MRQPTVGALLVLFTMLGLATGPAPAEAQVNGAIAYTDVLDKGTPTARRAVFKYPGGAQVSHPSGPLGKDSDSGPAWSPDGKSLAFIRLVQGSPSEYTIMVANADGTNARVIGRQYFDNGNPTGLYGYRPVALTWSPDSKTLGIGAVCTGGSTCWRALTLAVGGSVSVFGGFTNFFPASAGFDWGEIGLVAGCFNFNLPANLNNLFCVWNNSFSYYTTLERDAANPTTEGAVIGVPRWKYDSRGPRVAFVYHHAYAVGSGSHAATGIFSIKPGLANANGPNTGTDLKRHTSDPDFVSCTNTSGGVTTTSYTARYAYSQVSPSPDGKFFATKRVETEPVTDPQTKLCTFKSVNTGIYVLRDGGIVQNLAALGDDVSEPAWQQSPANVTIVIDDGHGNELRGLDVKLLTIDDQQPVSITPVNPTSGQYQFEAVPPGDYRVRATLTDADAAAFEVRHEFPSAAPVWADFELRITPDLEHVERHFSFSEDQTGFLTASIENDGQWERLDDMAAIYFQLRRFVDWVRANLTTNTGVTLPFHTFATIDPIGREVLPLDGKYFASQPVVVMGVAFSSYPSRDDSADDSPVNGEWHEYAHHLDATNRHPGLSCPGEDNHGGYVNVSSCDSLDEGIAAWLPTMFARNPDYAGLSNFEAQTKAWDVRFRIRADANGSPTFAVRSAEDMAVPALLWDLVDATDDAEFTVAIPGLAGLPDQHLLVAYTDNVSLPLGTVWNILGTYQPANVRELQQALDAYASGALTVDLDGDGLKDVNDFDPLFLMHGFFPITPDQFSSPGHKSYHYSVNSARQAGVKANAYVGLTNHQAFNSLGLISPERIPRSRTPASESTNISLEVRDASGTPLKGADVLIELHYPGFSKIVERKVAQGDGKLVRLELPLHFSYLPPGADVPPCDPGTDLYVSVTMTARLNGHSSTNIPAFDNCEFVAALLATTGPAALSYTLEFPEDSTQPITTAQTYGAGQVAGTNATESWTVELLCQDPEVGGFASGCTRSEYRLDGAALTGYVEPVTITETGAHTFEYRSSDAASNDESFRSISFRVGSPPATISGFTPTSGAVGALITVSGQNFVGATAVAFNGVGASFTVNSTTQLTTTVPPGATTGPIAVTTPGGAATSNASFTVIPPPAVDGFSPDFGGAESTVTITGSNFTGATRVAFNGVSASYTINSATQITALVPAGASTGPIAVTTAGGTASSSAAFVVTVGIAPSIASFSPMSGPIGTSVTIKGSNLSGASAVIFNGVSATFRLKGSSISTAVPIGATTGPIRVTTPGGWVTSVANFVVIPPPTIVDFSPSSGASGSTVTISGTNLSGVTSVKFGGASATFVVTSATALTATVPRNAKTAPINVTTAGGTATSSASFTVTKL